MQVLPTVSFGSSLLRKTLSLFLCDGMDVVFLPEQFGNDAMPGGIIGVCFVMCGMVRNFFKFEMKFSLRRFSTERTPLD